MLIEKCGLPFPRGKTHSHAGSGGRGGLVTMADQTAAAWEGKTYQVPDTIHGTGQFVVLRVVKNDAAADLAVNRLVHRFSTTSNYDWGRRIAGLATANGTLVGKPMDDAYFYGADGSSRSVVATIATNDLFYVVDEGPCDVMTETTTKFSVGQAAAVADTDGYAAAAAADDDSFGTAMEINGTAAVTACLFYIKGGIQGETP